MIKLPLAAVLALLLILPAANADTFFYLVRSGAVHVHPEPVSVLDQVRELLWLCAPLYVLHVSHSSIISCSLCGMQAVAIHAMRQPWGVLLHADAVRGCRAFTPEMRQANMQFTVCCSQQH